MKTGLRANEGASGSFLQGFFDRGKGLALSEKP